MSSAWGHSWSSAWGQSWGKKPVVEALERSGVQRLWMYQLYEESIEADRKRKEEQQKPAEAPIVQKQAKSKPVKRRKALLKKAVMPKAQPTMARAFYRNYSNDNIIELIDDTMNRLVSLPTLSNYDSVIKCEDKPVVVEPECVAHFNEYVKKTKKRRRRVKNVLFLLAA